LSRWKVDDGYIMLIKINIIINTHKDWLQPVTTGFDRSFDFPNCEGLRTGPQSRSFAVLGITVLKRSGPVQSRFFCSLGTGLSNTNDKSVQ